MRARAFVRGVASACAVGPVASSREMGRRGGALYGAGAVLVLLSLAIPHDGTRAVVALAVVAVAALNALGLWFAGDRIPPSLYALFTALGTVIITVLVHFGTVDGVTYAMLYVWAALFAFYFYRLEHAVLQTALIALCVGFFGAGTPADRLLVVGTVAVAGIWTQLAVVQVRGLAHTDAVTAVPNRRAWDGELGRAVARAHRDRIPLCIAILDLDHFKVFNDEQGHTAGDMLLRALAQTWLPAVRAGDMLVRYGGEEFAVLLPGSSLDAASGVIERLRSLVPRGLTCSAGLAMLAEGETAEALTSRADAALYEAKIQGRNRAVIAPGPWMDNSSGWLAQSTRWAGTVLAAIERGSVDAVFQPVARLDDGKVIGYEALARPDGPRAPGSVEGFFSAAQRMGVTRELDYICRRSAIDVARALPHRDLLFLNMSVANLLDPEHPADQLQLVLGAAGLDARRIVLEISERETITNVERLRRRVAEYREAGFRFAVDDVGEGHSTLQVLATTTPEFVKVAMTFSHAVQRPGQRAAIAAIVLFASQSGAQVIAEGIEDAATASALRDLGVGLGQGYFLGPPLPVDAQLTARRRGQRVAVGGG